jgi:hypothetical protein
MKYKLLKDLPRVPAGEIFTKNRRSGKNGVPDSYIYIRTDGNGEWGTGVMAPFDAAIVENTPEWFEAVE